MNAAETQEIKSLLLRNDNGYQELAYQHHLLDDRLHQLAERQHLSDSEHVEELTLKKRKLALKDRMEEMARLHSDHQHQSH